MSETDLKVALVFKKGFLLISISKVLIIKLFHISKTSAILSFPEILTYKNGFVT